MSVSYSSVKKTTKSLSWIYVVTFDKLWIVFKKGDYIRHGIFLVFLPEFKIAVIYPSFALSGHCFLLKDSTTDNSVVFLYFGQ